MTKKIDIRVDIRAEMTAYGEETLKDMDYHVDNFVNLIKRRLPPYARVNEVIYEVRDR